ncbi:polysaccharide biosynthesis C-terminal domain-containing protein [Candidatus Manganitrophus noduliformans]|uniref:Oligosaccharide flippase family protein n=1 Tax=Candidatus Manganitrophus noduliformans TaxID=2606439 RepID=A0A7X6ICX9_9BACT|nr:polysaccharide biosynthesis C-terminal domain-containing protein [Candidatus Manganitrophus noduliformans]NKE73148.1 oligosaccharide flippase family protein [Candidatus Manganitrophus noduliformans]
MTVELILKLPHHAWSQVKQAFFRTEKTRILLWGSIGSLVVRAIGMGLRMLAGILLARILGATGYGIYAYAVTWLGFLTIPTIMGLDQVLLRFVAAYKETRGWSALKGVVKFSILLGLAAAGVTTLFSISFVSLFSDSNWDFQATMWITLALLPIVVLGQLRQSALRGLNHPMVAQIPENIVYPGLLLLFAFGASLTMKSPLTVIQIAVANAAAWVGSFLTGTFLLARRMPYPVSASEPSYQKTEWLKMVPPLIFIGGAYHLLSRGDLLVLGIVGTSREVGVYSIVSRGAELMLFIYDAITLAGASLFSSIYVTGDYKELQRFTTLATKTILWISLPIFFILIGIAPWFLGLFGAEFVEGYGVMRLLTTTYFIGSLSGFVITMLYMTGHQRDVAIVMGVMAIVNLALSFLLIPWLGITGAAIASGTTLILLKGTLVIVLYKRVGIISLPFSFKRACGTQQSG